MTMQNCGSTKVRPLVLHRYMLNSHVIVFYWYILNNSINSTLIKPYLWVQSTAQNLFLRNHYRCWPLKDFESFGGRSRVPCQCQTLEMRSEVAFTNSASHASDTSCPQALYVFSGSSLAAFNKNRTSTHGTRTGPVQHLTNFASLYRARRVLMHALWIYRPMQV